MALRVIFSNRALSDIEAIADYIAADSPAYARTVVRKIFQATRNLAQFPRSGRKVPEFNGEDLREVFVYSYRVIYRIKPDRIEVAAVVHGKRML